MKITILQPAKFPLECSNPDCTKIYDSDAFIEYLHRRGIVYADCGDRIYQGFSCELCNHSTVISCNRREPLVDLNNFLLQPTPDSRQNIAEQIHLKKNRNESDTNLSFKFIPAWDESGNHATPSVSSDITKIFPSLFVEEKMVENLQDHENKYRKILLRRLCLDIPRFRHALTLSSPNQAIYDGYEILDNSIPSEMDVFTKKEAINYFAQRVGGKSIYQIVTEELMELECSSFSEKDFQKIYKNLNQPLDQHLDISELQNMMSFVGWEDNLFKWQGWSPAVAKIVGEIKQKLPFTRARKKLGTWFHMLSPGKALIVDAPMGLGKSTSIVNTLSEELDLSAVIFMPTVALCQDISHRLKIRIAQKKNLNDCFETVPGSFVLNYARHEYLIPEVFLVEGINKVECHFFDEITESYSRRWYIKQNFCQRCPKTDNCRFTKWTSEACKSRIIVATHNQYNVFNKNKDLHNWVTSEKEDKSQPRDMFIVDEDLAFTQCYSPVVQNPEELRHFCSSFPEFLEEYFSNHKERYAIIDKLDALFALTNKPDTTAVIPPVDSDFTIPEKIKNLWSKKHQTLHAFVPDYIENSKPIVNLLDVVEHGIKYGVVVQRYSKQSSTGESNHINKIFFPNPTTYDLSSSPAHVFFDGTRLDIRFMENKLKGVEFETFSINPGFNWRHVVYQNTNTDLSASNIEREQERVKECLSCIFSENGTAKSYFIHTTKAIRQRYLDDFLTTVQDSYRVKVMHYGNLRGSNDAQECNVHIMLGSYNPSDALEVAMSLEFLQDTLKSKEPMATYPNLWRWKGSVARRTYIDDYDVINQISKAYRHAEQRQALARTRSIFHDVAFYIFAKEPVHEYELTLPEAKTTQYGDQWFPPRKQRSDNQYNQVKNAIIGFLSRPGFKGNKKTEKESNKKIRRSKKRKACDMDIRRLMHEKGKNTHRNTIRIHRDKMIEEGLIQMISKRYYELVINNESVSEDKILETSDA